MAVISVYSKLKILYKNKNPPDFAVGSDILSFTSWTVKPPASRMTFLSGYAAITNNLPISLVPASNLNNVAKGRSFYDDYYNRIHIIPGVIDVGNLVSDQYVNVEIWNAYFASKTLQSIGQSGTSGISFVGATPPSIWNPLQSKTYQITVTTEGDPDINAVYSFNWVTSYDNNTLSIVGSRIVSFVYPFEAPAMEYLEWKTDVITSNNGSEQRIRVRKAPRQSYKIKYPLQNEDLRAAENRAYGWVSRRWAVPLWSEAQQIASISSGVNSVSIDTTKTDYRNNSLVYIYESNSINATMDINTVASNSLSLKRATGSAYANPWVMPVRVGRAKGGIRRNYLGYQGNLEIEFEFTDNIDLGSGTTPTQFLGEDIYYDQILMGEELTDEIFTRIDSVDFEVGISQTYSPWTYAKIRRPFQYILQGLSEIWTFRKWLHRRAGKLRPFWIPTFENNLSVIETGTVTTNITVKADDYKLFGSDRNHIAILLNDGTWIPRTIQSIVDLGNNQIAINLDTALTSVTSSMIKSISFLGLKRLDTDRVEIKWDTNRTVYCTIPMIELTP